MSRGFSIRGIQEAQRENNHLIANMRPGAGLGRAVQYATIEAHRYAVAITHVDTGSLRASHRMEVSGLRGRIYIDPASINPKTRSRPAVYGLIEHNRGGAHAFYERTANEWQTYINQARILGMITR